MRKVLFFIFFSILSIAYVAQYSYIRLPRTSNINSFSDFKSNEVIVDNTTKDFDYATQETGTTLEKFVKFSHVDDFSTGSVMFIGSDVRGFNGLKEDNSNLYWDDSNNRLGIGTSSPTDLLDIKQTSAEVLFGNVYRYQYCPYQYGYTERYYQSRGTVAIPATSEVGDYVVANYWYGHDGDSFNHTIGEFIKIKGISGGIIDTEYSLNFSPLHSAWYQKIAFDSDELMLNEDSQDYDFRVESNNSTAMLFVDGGNDRVGIKTLTPSYELDVNGTINATYYTGEVHKFRQNGFTDDLVFTYSSPLKLAYNTIEIYYEGNYTTLPSGTVNLTNNASNYIYWPNTGTTLSVTSSKVEVDDGISIAYAGCQTNEIVLYGSVECISHADAWVNHAIGEIMPVAVVEGMIVTPDPDVTSNLDVMISSGEYYRFVQHMKEITSPVYSRTTQMKKYYHNSAGDWTYHKSSTVPTSWYDSGAGTVAVTTGKYYRGLFLYASNEIMYVVPTTAYNTLAQALAGTNPTVPPGLNLAVSCTALVIQANATTLPAAGNAQWIDSRPIYGSVSPSTTGDHGDLSGLTDDDHPQYLITSEVTSLISTSTGFFDGGETAGKSRTLGNNDNYSLGFRTGGNTRIDITSDGYMRLYKADLIYGSGAEALMYIDISGADTGEIRSAVSSEKYKKNIVDAPKYDIKNLRVREFDMRKSNRHDFGLIAEEVDLVNPMLVCHDDIGEPRAVRYEMLSVVLLQALQDALKRIDSLEVEINKLK